MQKKSPMIKNGKNITAPMTAPAAQNVAPNEAIIKKAIPSNIVFKDFNFMYTSSFEFR